MLDPFTHRDTQIKGHVLPGPEGRARIQDDHRRRLEAFDRLSACAAECGVRRYPDRDLLTVPEDAVSLLELGDPLWAAFGQAIREWRRLVPLLTLSDFGFLDDGDNPLEEANALLTKIGGGVEAWAFQSLEEGSVYKFYIPAEGTKDVGSTFAFRRGDETEFAADANGGSYRQLLEKLYLIELLAGMPTEIVAVTPDGVLIAKQVPGSPLPQGEDVSGFLPKGLIEIPSRFLRVNRDHPRLFFVDDVPFLVADIHARNIVKDHAGELRVIDLVASEWPSDTYEKVPLIREWLERVRIDPKAGALPTSPDDDL